MKIEESPWGDWHGKPITANGLSRLLRPFRIKTMAVKAEGRTVRGYKAEQFAEAFHRVLGVTGVTSVTSRTAWEAEGNAGNAGNALSTGEGTNGRTPFAGDEDFLDFILPAHRAGHITTNEALEREQTHKLIRTARAA